MAVVRHICVFAVLSLPLLAQSDAIARLKQLNGVLRQNAGDRKKLAVKSSSTQDLRPVLAERAGLLATIIRTNPNTAAGLALSPTETAELRASGVDASLIETPAVYDAPAESIAIDSAAWTDSYMLYRMNTADGAVDAYAAGDVAKLSTCGESVHVEGLRVGTAMLATYVGVTKELPANATCLPTGEQKIAVLMVNFPDSKHTLTKGDIDQVYFDGGFQSIANHTAENSSGAASVTGQVFGPYTLDRAYSCTETTALRTAAINAANADVDWTQFQHIHIVVPTLTGSCGWAGLGTIGCNTLTAPGGRSIRATTAWIISGTTQRELRRVATHELGHNYGVGHARTMFFPNTALAPDRSKATYVEYGDLFSLMGSGGTTSGVQNHFAAQHKAKLGWIKSGETYTEVSAPGTYEIAPAEITDGKVRALKVKRNLSGNEFIWVEYRQPIGMFDKDISGNYANVFKGALIHYENAGTAGYSELLNMNVNLIPGTGVPANDVTLGHTVIPEGAVWQDPYSDLTLRVKSVTADALTVEVQYDSRCASFDLASSPIGPSQTTLSVPVTATASCSWNALANNFWLATTSKATGTGKADFTLANAGDFGRPGSVTIGRRTVFVSQLPVPQPSTVAYVTPSSAKIPTNRYVFHEVGVQVPNGVETLTDVEVRWSAGDGTLCGVKYNYPTKFLFVVGDNGGYLPEPIVSGGSAVSNSQCTISPTFGAIRSSATESQFWFNVMLKSAWTGDRALMVRLTDASGPGTWQTIRSETAGPMCFASTNFGKFSVGAGSGSTSFSVIAPNCDWQITTSADWLKFSPSSGTGTNNSVTVTFTENKGDSERQADITLGENAAYIIQRAHGYEPVDATLEPGEVQLPAEGGGGQVTVNAESLDVAWTPMPSDSWIQITRTIAAGGISDGSFLYRVGANPSSNARQGFINVAGRTFGIYQAGGTAGKPLLDYDGVQNGASFVTGVTANSFVTIKGVNLASTTRVWTGADFQGNNLPRSLDNVRVNINGLPAYIYYISATQLNVIAPAGTPTGSMNVEVINDSGTSAPVTVNGATVMPAFFMVDASKHVAAVGTDGLIIGIHRSAKPGETLQLYGTGFGATNPGYPDGQIPGVVPLRSNISVNVGGRVTTNVPAYLVAPGEYQVNVTVPTATPDGDATLQVNVGGVVSPVVYIPVKR